MRRNQTLKAVLTGLVLAAVIVCALIASDGSEGGGLNITVNNTHMTLNGEGTNVLGIGCFDESCILSARETTLDIHLLAAENIAIGARDENCTFEGGKRILLIND